MHECSESTHIPKPQVPKPENWPAFHNSLSNSMRTGRDNQIIADGAHAQGLLMRKW